MPTDQSISPYNWYDLSQPEANYAHTVCRWGAGLAATSKALAALFERMAEYQLQSTQDIARLARDPNHMAQAYADYGSRMMQMHTEMQGSMEKIQREADLLYENLRRSLDDAMSARVTSPMGAQVVSPAMKYGAAASAGVDGPGGWQFDPSQLLPGPDSGPPSPPMPQTPSASTVATAAPANAPTSNAPMWPSMPFMPPMPPMSWLYPQGMSGSTTPLPSRYDEISPPRGIVLQTTDPTDADVAASLAETRAAQAMFPPVPAAPPAPASIYPAACATTDAASGVSYRCDGYRRVARAKL
jgi:hypothetical protein